jgi:ketosteroid isomerase-like protein
MTRGFTLTSLVLVAIPLTMACSSPTVADQSALSATHTASTADRDADISPTGADAKAEAEVRQRDAAEVEAFLADDVAALAGLWSDTFVVTNPFNQFVNKQQVLSLVTSGTLAFTSYLRHIEYVHVYQDIVIVAGSETVVWAGRIPLAGQTSNLRYTAVWARHGNEWQEVARHANLVLPGVPAGPPSH